MAFERRDAFLSHASEEKEEIARPLANRLELYGLKIWYDEFSLHIGDSLSASIDHGLLISDYGIVIISKKFFEKGWTKLELSALISKQVNQNKRIILPIWHKISKDEIHNKSPILADTIAANSNEGIENLARKLYMEIRGIRKFFDFSSEIQLKSNISARFKSIHERESLNKETEQELMLIILTKVSVSVD